MDPKEIQTRLDKVQAIMDDDDLNEAGKLEQIKVVVDEVFVY